ncbi:TIGR04086 family membrane protein [Flavobacterium sp. CLA17]|uniref:TIGR04086 family membrane protein n=1 Tax=Flavobacterium sp. CLA17 TaxID=2724135 RepID=UPI0014923EFE|nr:TIGR04086 family membrane protein [Flavobacterium sp. CLA17]QSB27686.1 TIGR04086 family membrane protein [Flavobacterium sp. CLA17]
MSFIDKIISKISVFEERITELETKFSNYQVATTNSETLSTLETTPVIEIPLTEIEEELFIQSVDISVIDIIKQLAFSLLSGEYISIVNIIESLEAIENTVKDFPNKTNSLPTNLQVKIFEFSSSVNMSIEGYIIFIRDISNVYSNDRLDFLFSHNNQIEKIIRESNLSSKIDSVTDYFFYLITLSRIDHFPSNENNYISSLFDVEKRIKNLDLQEYSAITKNVFTKISFLKHKWKSRKFNENPTSILYEEDGIIKKIEDFKDDNNAKLKEWADIIETQYELISRDWKYILQSRIKDYKGEENFDRLKTLEIHQLIKYYKDVKPNYSKLNEIKKYLEKKIELSINKYDKYASSVSYNYSLNNCFSLFLINHDDFENVKDEYSKINEGVKGNVNNFFLQFKYLEFVTKYLLTKINDDEKVKYIEKYESIIENHCKSEVESYFDKKEWSKSNHNYVFILPFNECLVPTSELDGLNNIFYASSFVLPPSIEKMEKDFNEIKNDFDKINLYINTGKYFKKEIEKIESLNNELDKKDFKSIEIISIFTAIITFVLASIPSFKFVDNVWQALLFMLSLASALGIFVALVLFATRGFKNNVGGIIYAIVLFLIAFVGYNSLASFEKKEVKFSKKINKELDSIALIKVDSILKKRNN